MSTAVMIVRNGGGIEPRLALWDKDLPVIATKL